MVSLASSRRNSCVGLAKQPLDACTRRGLLLLSFIAALCLFGTDGASAQTPPLQLETTIALGEVAGRIDHMAVDVRRQRLFVAELGNNTLGVVDLAQNKLLRTITGLKTPQGVGYEPAADTVYVANAGDGAVHLFEGADLVPAGTVALGEDADNIRVDVAGRRVFVSYGKGALAVIDATTRQKVADVPLDEHPEGFQLDPEAGRVFVNLPNTRSIAVVDSAAGKAIANWPQTGRDGNYPMILDPAGRRVFVVFRRPALLAAFAMADGALIGTTPVCGDSDDVFFDAKRRRAYVTCGEGFVDVVDVQAPLMARLAHIPTASGARTSLFIPDLDRLVIAVPARGAQAAAVWVFRPAP
jgi:DNA-binding beta-propeller fold protein YncE